MSQTVQICICGALEIGKRGIWNRMIICSKEKCTACGACINVCRVGAISYEIDSVNKVNAKIDDTLCINCGLCKKVCPEINKCAKNQSIYCYAAWSCDEGIRKNSASGGIATELGLRAVEESGMYAGVSMDVDNGACFRLVSSKDDVLKLQNSKYVHSNTGNIFTLIRDVLKNTNKQIVFVGLPCQVAGLKNYLSIFNANTNRVLFVDLVCHGTVPFEYLKQHVRYLEGKKHKTDEVLFRDPEFGTNNYFFSLKDSGTRWYTKKTNRDDTYQIGFHKGLIYRENCYSCQYACRERTGDITLADFGGVGKEKPCDYSNENVSCVLINTNKGLEWIGHLQTKCFFEERPIMEEYNTEMMFQRPTPKHPNREIFMKHYKEMHNFERAAQIALKKQIIQNEFIYYLRINQIKLFLWKMMPQHLRRLIKEIISKRR